MRATQRGAAFFFALVLAGCPPSTPLFPDAAVPDAGVGGDHEPGGNGDAADAGGNDHGGADATSSDAPADAGNSDAPGPGDVAAAPDGAADEAAKDTTGGDGAAGDAGTLADAAPAVAPPPSGDAADDSSSSADALDAPEAVDAPGDACVLPDALEADAAAPIVDAGVTTSGWVRVGACPLAATAPPMGVMNTVVYDPDRGNVVLLGAGPPYGLTSQTWLWNGGTGAFTNLTSCPGTAPSPAGGGGAAYDSGRHRVVLVSVENRGTEQTVVWELDPAKGVWTDRTPTVLPTAWPNAGGNHHLIYDAGRARVLLWQFTLSDGREAFWEWDGTTGAWLDRTSTSSPGFGAAPEDLAMAYDGARAVTVAYVLSGAGPTRQLEFDGATGVWTDKTPSPLPPNWPSSVNSLVDTGGGKLVLWGGDTRVWDLDGATGVLTDRTLASPPLPPNVPFYTRGVAIWDMVRARMVVYGNGDLGSFYRRLWDWDDVSDTWTLRSSGEPAQLEPLYEYGSSVAFDSARGRVVLFSGLGYEDSLGVLDSRARGTWEWNGGSASWSRRSPASSPWSRLRAATAFDERRGRLVVFGGSDGLPGYSPELHDVWEWSGGGVGVWSGRTPSPLPVDWPSAREGAAAAYDVGRGKFVMFGGTTSAGDLDDLWEWDGAAGTWTNRTPATLPDAWPPARAGHAMSYDRARCRVVIFGGFDGFLASDTWEWDGEGGVWTNRTVRGTPAPPARRWTSMAYDVDRGRMVLAGGQAGSVALDDVWEWDGATGTWTDHTPAVRPAEWPHARFDAPLVWDGVRRRVLMIGGRDQTGLMPGDMWQWGGD